MKIKTPSAAAFFFACAVLLGTLTPSGAAQEPSIRECTTALQRFTALVNANKCGAAYALVAPGEAVDKAAELAQLKQAHALLGRLTIGKPASAQNGVLYAELNFGPECSGKSILYSLQLTFQSGGKGLIEGEFERDGENLRLRRVSLKAPWTDKTSRKTILGIAAAFPKEVE